MKDILVTGGCGYIGSHTVVQLLEGGYNVTILDNLCNSKKSVLDRIEQITGKKPAFIKADIRNYEEMEKIRVNEDIVEKSLIKFFQEGCGKSPNYYKPDIISKKIETYRRSRKKGEFDFLENGIYEGDFIGSDIANYTCTQECSKAVNTALYIET